MNELQTLVISNPGFSNFLKIIRFFALLSAR